jgi:hypothetical protein
MMAPPAGAVPSPPDAPEPLGADGVDPVVPPRGPSVEVLVPLIVVPDCWVREGVAVGLPVGVGWGAPLGRPAVRPPAPPLAE